MKILIVLGFLSLGLIASAANTYYIATNGSDSNPGTLALPWKSWQKGFNSLLAGDILYIRGGNYTVMYSAARGVSISGKNGTTNNRIIVLAYPGEIPVLDCSSLALDAASSHYGILLNNCNYWNIKGLTVKNVREHSSLSRPTAGWELGSGCTNITLDQCIVTGCGNGFTLSGTLYNIKYLNCDAYLNYDYYDGGGLANGFNGNVRVGSTITYEGCRSWSNSDEGWDNYAGSGYMTYYNCWAYRNGYDVPTSGNGDGFKLGYDNKSPYVNEPGIQRTLYNCISAANKLMGYDESMDGINGMDMALYNCIAYGNTRDYGFRFYKTTGTSVTTLKNNIAYLNNVNYQGRAANISSNNTWDAGAPIVTNSDFVSIDMSQLILPRKADGSLPDITCFHLATGSDLINAGTNIGRPFNGSTPDLGPFESDPPTGQLHPQTGNISVYPNPARTFVDISRIENRGGTQSVRIFDLTGALVSEAILNPDISNRISLNFKPGLYILQVNAGSEVLSVNKLIVIE